MGGHPAAPQQGPPSKGPPVSRTLAVANQKGGVAKTTTVLSLGAALTELGVRVLLVDLDAQSSLTFSLGVDPDEVEVGTAEVILGGVDAAGAVLHAADGLDLLPATVELSALEARLAQARPSEAGAPRRELALRAALAPLAASYDVVLLDCSPSLGLVTINALAAADEVVVPLQCEMLSHRGVGQLLDTVDDVRRLLNPGLTVRGVLPTMYDARTAHQRAVLADVGDRFGVPVLSPPIPRSVRFAEAPALGRSVLRTSGRSAGAQAYRELALSLAAAWGVPPKGRARTRRGRRPPAG